MKEVTKREIVGILMLSPIYFLLDPSARLETVKQYYVNINKEIQHGKGEKKGKEAV